jgi:hypothetical protein
MLQNYGAIQSINLEEGRKLGEIEAAKNQLDIAQEGMNTAGEALVKQGLLPRSQLLGYQQGYRRRIGERVARNTYHQGLNDRLNEIKDPEADEDVVNRVMAEVREESLKGLDGKPLAQEGFLKYATAVENSFVVSANKARDAAVQAHHENLAVEELNNEFGPRLIAANPDEIGGLQHEIKQHLDSLSNEDRFEKSKVVEMFWNGVGMPTVSGLIVDGQPDKAEKVLEAMLDIDLTGKGGKLGNINREGAWIRSRAVELRNKIESKRNQLESEYSKEADNIENLYAPAATAVIDGITGNVEMDQRNISAVARILQDAGYPEEEAGLMANSLIASQDIQELGRNLTKYMDDDSKRNAYGEAVQRFTRFNILASQEKQYFVTTEQIEQSLSLYKLAKKQNPNLSSSEWLALGGGIGQAPVTDPKAKAAIIGGEVEIEKQQWFDGTDAQQTSKRNYRDHLKGIVVGIQGDDERALTDATFLDPFINDFETEYANRITEASIKLSDDPDRDTKMREAETQISTELSDRWKRLQETLKIADEARLDEDDPDPLPSLEELEDQETVLHRQITPWWYLITPRGIGTPPEDIPTERKDAIKYAEKLEERLKEGTTSKGEELKGKRTKAYSDVSNTIRKIFGFNSITEVPDKAFDEGYDYRMTPMLSDRSQLRKLIESFQSEFDEFTNLPLAQQQRDDFQTLRLMLDKFGIIDKEGMKHFIDHQNLLLKSK